MEGKVFPVEVELGGVQVNLDLKLSFRLSGYVPTDEIIRHYEMHTHLKDFYFEPFVFEDGKVAGVGFVFRSVLVISLENQQSSGRFTMRVNPDGSIDRYLSGESALLRAVIISPDINEKCKEMIPKFREENPGVLEEAEFFLGYIDRCGDDFIGLTMQEVVNKLKLKEWNSPV